jgi:hypothetical protein
MELVTADVQILQLGELVDTSGDGALESRAPQAQNPGSKASSMRNNHHDAAQHF